MTTRSLTATAGDYPIGGRHEGSRAEERVRERPENMKISVAGTGHVGLVTAACFAHVGHEVLGVDDDAQKIELIERGEVPFHEPGLLDLVRDGLASGRLHVTTDTARAARHGD